MIKEYDPKTAKIAKAIPFPKYIIDSPLTIDKMDPPSKFEEVEAWKPINVLGDTGDEVEKNVYYTKNEGRVFSNRKRHERIRNRKDSGSDISQSDDPFKQD